MQDRDARSIDLTLEPLDDYVVIQPSDEESETNLGLIIPASTETDCRTGVVTAVGSDPAGIEPGDKVLVLNTGHFGQRFVDINRCYGADVEEISPGFRGHASPDAVRKRLAGGRFKALFVTHVDTGTTE